MATTTNYGWTTPDDTALVKDGAAAIRTLGSSVDTTTKALNPSTTLGDIEYRSSTANTNTRLPIGSSGQVLTVAAGVPSWANAFTNPLTTTGDVIYSSSGSTPARLGIGSTGNVLTVSGGLPVWSAPSSGGMTLLSTTSLSGATTTISSISGSYNSLYAVIYGFTNATATGQFRLAPNGSTGITNTAYHNTGNPVSWAAAAVNYLLLSASGVAGPTYTNATNSLVLRIDNYADTNSRKPFHVYGGYTDSDTGLRTYTAWGHIDTTSAITSLVFSNSGGNHNGGTVLLYGVK